MKLIIGDVEYPLANINEASLDDLMALRKETGLGIKALRQHLDAVSTLDSDDVLDDPDALLAIGALVWLARRKAGERLTLEQACDFPLAQLQIVDDGEAVTEVDDVDPKSDSGSDSPTTTTSQMTSEPMSALV